MIIQIRPLYDGYILTVNAAGHILITINLKLSDLRDIKKQVDTLLERHAAKQENTKDA